MFSLKSAGIAAGLVANAAGITYAIGYSAGLFNSNIQIANLLDQENKYSLLSFENNQEQEDWNKAWEKYKADNAGKKENQDKWKVNGWKETEVAVATEGFKKACSSRKNINVSGIEDTNYKEFVKYCTRSKTMEEVLTREGFKLLSVSSQDDKWTNKFNLYKTSNNQLPDAKVSQSDSQKTFTTLRDGCKEALKLRLDDIKYQNAIDSVKEWCRQ